MLLQFQQTEMQLEGINISKAEQHKLVTKHLPWGIPLSGSLSADVTLLHHTDHVTGEICVGYQYLVKGQISVGHI